MPCRYPQIVPLIERIRRLKDVPDSKKVGPDGRTIEGRMQTLCVNAAEDIKQCANTCDAYLKSVVILVLPPLVPNHGFRKKILVRILAGPIWEVRLLEFVEIFAKRQKEFEFALAIHTANEANTKPDTVKGRTAELNQKYVT